MSRGYALCLAAFSFSRHRRTVIRLSLSPPAAPILCFWKKLMLVSDALLLLQLDDVALEETNNCCTSHSFQPVTCLSDGPPQLRIPCAHFQAPPCYVHHISRSLQLSFRLGISTPTSPWFPLFLGWDHQLSGSRDGCGKCGFHVVTLLSSGGLP